MFFHFSYLFVLLITAINKMDVTPAPTAASVKATSGDFKISHKTDIINEYAEKMMTAESKSFVLSTAIAQTIRNTTKITLNIIIDLIPPMSHFSISKYMHFLRYSEQL